MKKQIIRLTENDIKRLVMESVNQVLMENEQDESWWDGIKGAVKQKAQDAYGTAKSKIAQAGIGTQEWRDKQGTRGKNGQWYRKGMANGEKNPTMSQSYLNHNIAGDIEKAIKLIESNSDYLWQFGIDTNAFKNVIKTLQSFIDMVKKGGTRMQRGENNRFAGLGNQNLTPREVRRTRSSSVTPGASIMNV